MKSIILEICRSYQNANILLKMLSVLHTLYRYVLLSLVAHAGMVVTCIALQKKNNNQKTPPPQRTVGNVIFACNDRSLHRRYERRTKTSLSL